MSLSEYQKDERSALVDLLRTMMVPDLDSTNTAPEVGSGNTTSFPTSVDYQLTFPIKDPVAFPTQYVAGLPTEAEVFRSDQVPFEKGLYMSFPQESVQSRYHMGFVKANSAVRKPIASIGSLLPNPGGGIATVVGKVGASTGIVLDGNYWGAPALLTGVAAPTYNDQAENAWALEFGADLVLPRVGPGNGFDISPQLDENYSKIREFASRMRITSSTISGTNFNLSGTFSSGVIADTRDIAQSSSANGAIQAYPVSALATQSVSRNSVNKNSQVLLGMVDVTGPDYPREWCAPDIDKTDTLAGEFAIIESGFNYNANPFTGLPAADANNTAVPINIMSTWITPWQTNFWVASNSSGSETTPPANHSVIKTSAINEDGVLDIRVKVAVSVLGSGGAAEDVDVRTHLRGSFMHVFAFVDSNGHVGYNVFSDKVNKVVSNGSEKWNRQLNNSYNGLTQAEAPQIVLESTPRMDRSGFAIETGGKYLGTYLNLAVGFLNASTGVLGEVFSVDVEEPEIAVRARNIDAPGRIGPTHVIRYDDLSKDQVLQMNGIALIQGVAKGNIQSIVQRAMGITSIPASSLNRIIDQLFTYSESFRRIMTAKDYEEVKKTMADLNIGYILKQLDKAPDEQAVLTKALGAAAGLFGSLGGLVGAGVDALTGNKDGRGAQIGAGIGGFGDSLAPGGASGAYNLYGGPGSGQRDGAMIAHSFGGLGPGQAAGMLSAQGESAGMFSAGSRRGRDY